MTNLLVITPLLNAVTQIQQEHPIPIKGSKEFRFLASTYNRMYSINEAHKEKLIYEARHDQLTGLYNRYGYEELLKTIDTESIALLLIDVDKFKTINDTYGHDVGDNVMAHVADVIKGVFLQEAYICRIGGDEFAIIIIQEDSISKEIISERIKRINESLSNTPKDFPPTSISVGVAFGNDPDSTGDLFKDADIALYRAKENGRHDCVFYEV